jgi:hypothetical protein
MMALEPRMGSAMPLPCLPSPPLPLHPIFCSSLYLPIAAIENSDTRITRRGASTRRSLTAPDVVAADRPVHRRHVRAVRLEVLRETVRHGQTNLAIFSSDGQPTVTRWCRDSKPRRRLHGLLLALDRASWSAKRETQADSSLAYAHALMLQDIPG